jgi:hypothetical protein
MITALDLATEETRCLLQSYMPPLRRMWDQADHSNYRVWTNNLKIFRCLRRKLARAEALIPKMADRRTPA